MGVQIILSDKIHNGRREITKVIIYLSIIEIKTTY